MASGTDLAYFLRLQGRMQGLNADMISALTQAFAQLRSTIGVAALTEWIRTGQIDRLIAETLSDPVLERSFLPVRDQLEATMQRAFQQTVRDLPKAGAVDGTIAVSFGMANPAVVTAVQTVEAKVIAALSDDARAAVRAAVEIGIANGESAASIARGLGDVIGLGPSQVQEVANFRDALLGINGRSLADYNMRNRAVDRLVAKQGSLTDAQVERFTDAYRDSRIALNAKTVAQTATRLSYKAGQQLSWQDAKANGLVPDGYTLTKTWVGVMDDRERPEHVAMEGETVPADGLYSNGNDVPGDDTFNCRCVSRFKLARLRIAKFILTILLFISISFNDIELKANIPGIFNKDNSILPTYKAFFAKSQFDQIKTFIAMPQNTYKVACIGFYPSIPQFNGFYTLDSYQNFYPLDYKIKFRKIIEKELNKNAFLKSYYDGWGSRTYIFVAEIGSELYKYIGKKDVSINNLELNTGQLKLMNCKYIFSTMAINNTGENKLVLLKVFDQSESIWRIYLYGIQ